MLFLDATDTNSIIKGWMWLETAVGNAHSMEIPIVKVKSKFQDLQRTFRSFQAANLKTGNVKTQKNGLLGFIDQPFRRSRRNMACLPEFNW